MSWNRFTRVSLSSQDRVNSDILGLVSWLSSITSFIRNRELMDVLVNVWVCLCALAVHWMQHGRNDQHPAHLVNRSANSAYCALLVFPVMATSIWWTFFFCVALQRKLQFLSFPFVFLPCPPPLSSLITLSFSPLASSLLGPHSRCCCCRCCFRTSSQCECWTVVRTISAEWQEVKKEKKMVRGKKGRNTESQVRLQIKSTDAGKRWALLHACKVNDVWEYLLSTLQHQGHAIWKERNSICYSIARAWNRCRTFNTSHQQFNSHTVNKY